MRRNIYNGILIWSFTIIKAKEPELPLCPTNMQYFPQNLPMHCRMPVGSSRISRSPLDKPPQPLQMPMNGFPAAMPGAMPSGGFPGAIPGGMPVPMPGGFPGIPGGMPGPVPGGMFPMLPPPPGPSQKLPVIVMPFYSQDNSAKTPQIQPRQIRHKKHRKNHMKKKPKSYYSDEDSADIDTSDEDSSGSSSNAGWWKNSRQGRRTSHHKSNRRKHRKQELLTPVLQYVTKDGYVIYEKQISKGEAKGWLGGKNNEGNEDGAALKRQREQESREPKDEVETGFLLKEEERAESTTEDKPQVVYKKKNPKRKVFKKHDV